MTQRQHRRKQILNLLLKMEGDELLEFEELFAQLRDGEITDRSFVTGLPSNVFSSLS
jgi:hypothetical protein